MLELGERFHKWLKTGGAATIVLLMLLVLGQPGGVAPAVAGSPAESSQECLLRIVYGGALRGSIEPCG